ncbi:hypothetical protein [Gemella haemolysans]|uniref:Uncharacterized protein n=2 Tax=Gemella haemolysans TaxID=1379 RepID=A0AA87DY62_9BACL|nr:hypothetical protein [Gemella haemolysans]EGF87398.1 hypothetical protein HMPREF0428_00273 [Gemella haemolysans M341]QIX87876.1 hypothetical protein FOC48_03480 [Gemella haemolysans]
MTYGLNSSFKRQLNNKSKNKRLLSVIILVLIIVFSIVLPEREGGATPEESVKRWMKTVRNNNFEKMFDYIYYDNKKDKDESVQEFKKISKEEKYKLDMLKSFVNDNEIEEVNMIDLDTFIVRFKKINKKDNLDKKYLINDGRSFLTV